MVCVNFDRQFEKYATEWMKKNAAKYGNDMDRMEAKMPEVYLHWLNKPAGWLGGATPGEYFNRFDDAPALVQWMLQYHKERVPVPDQMLERITALGARAERVLLSLLEDQNAPQEARLTAVSMLSEMDSAAPMAIYIRWVACRGAQDDLAELAAEALIAMGDAVVPAVREAVKAATPEGREAFADILSNFPGEPLAYDLTLELFRENPENRALYASLLAKIGDARALPALMNALLNPTINYLDYVETRNAIEALGGDPPAERPFEGDPYYESMRRMN